MAQYLVTHSCGHTVNHHLFGPEDGRRRRIAWFETVPCLECHRAELARQAAEANAGLPALVGSAKQIAWAEQIRADALASQHNKLAFKPMDPDAVRRLSETHDIPLEACEARVLAVRNATTEAANRLSAETSAKWWIDNRHDIAHHVEDAYRAAMKREFADVLAREQAEREAKKAAETERLRAEQQRETESRTAAAAERAASEAAAAAAASTFVAQSVTVQHDDVRVVAQDGRVARGFIDGGDWAVYEVDGATVSSRHPEAERIAAEARALWSARNSGA